MDLLPLSSNKKKSTFFYYNTLSGTSDIGDDNNMLYTLTHCQHGTSNGLDECIEATSKMSIHQPYNNDNTASMTSLTSGGGPPPPSYYFHQNQADLNNNDTIMSQSFSSIIMPLGQGSRGVHWADDRAKNKGTSSISLAIKNDNNNNSINNNNNHPAFLPTNSNRDAISVTTMSKSQKNVQEQASNQPGMGQVLTNSPSSSQSTTVQYYTPERNVPYEQPVTYVITAVDSPAAREANAAGADSASNISSPTTTASFYANDNQNDPFERLSGIDKHSAMDWSKELTEDQIAEYYDAFCFFDRDGSGAISTAEIAQVLISIGQATSEIEVREMLALIDSNDSGSIDFPEFLKVMAQQRRKKEFLRDVRQAFKIFDKDGNGYITAVELRQVMTNMLGEKMTDDEVEALIFEADLDGDGQINFDEFVQFMFGYFEECKPNR